MPSNLPIPKLILVYLVTANMHSSCGIPHTSLALILHVYMYTK